jgi:cytosine/adenosine deaminase-related metal-dependent hydrolase
MYSNPAINQPSESAKQPANQADLPVRVYVAGMVCDAGLVRAAPGAIAVRGSRVLAAGGVDEVLRVAGPRALRTDLPDRVIVPGLVNAHTHLDLTNIGAQPFGGSFIDWVGRVIALRPRGAPEIEAAVRHGARLGAESGVLTVGDISGSVEAMAELKRSDLRGVAFLELLGLGGPAMEAALLRLMELERGGDDGAAIRSAVQPHAPYSCGAATFRAAAWASQGLGLPACSHLAETEEELEFVAGGGGPFRAMLEKMGRWQGGYEQFYREGLHPVEWVDRWVSQTAGDGDVEAIPLTPTLSRGERGQEGPRAPWLAVHCNYIEDASIALLAERGWSVAYCPRASDYFGHRGHRYRDMIRAGVNVALGTDSILCHGSLSILDEMRHLHRRDAVDPRLLLRMATVNGMHALGLPAIEATFAPGAAPGLVAIRYDPQSPLDALSAVLAAEPPPQITVLEPAAAPPSPPGTAS